MAIRPRPCARCGELIPVERIEALPETRLCIKCSREIGGDFELTVVPDNLAKTGSLKKNYAGWSVKKKRRDIRLKEE
jgi:Prokaryotic dksA/traR C4-type zinc finger